MVDQVILRLVSLVVKKKEEKKIIDSNSYTKKLTLKKIEELLVGEVVNGYCNF